MSLALRTSLGCTEAIIADDGTLALFYQVASLLEDQLGLQLQQKEDDFDSISWDFRYRHHLVTLHYNIYSGISLFPTRTRDAVYKDNKAVMEVAALVEKNLPVLSALRQSA